MERNAVQLAERVNRISVSATLAVLTEAERYKARGIDVVDFGPGEPDFPTPEHIKRAAIRAIEMNFTKYTATAGIAPLREAVCAWHAAQFGSSYAPGECIVSVGGKHAIFNAINALIEPGDEVLIPAPYWVSFPDIVKYAGGRPVFVPTEAADGSTRPYSVARIAGSKPHLIVVGSLSKTFSMTGWRVGYALAPQPLVDAMLKLQSQSTSNPTSISQYAALEALKSPMDSVATMLAEYARRRARILAGLRAIPGVTCTAPDGAFYVFPNVSARLGNGSGTLAAIGPQDTAALARLLLEREHLAVVPGEAFGAPGFLRFSYATSIERIEEGLRRLERFFASAESAS